MSYLFFESILTQLRYKLNYDAVVNYAGNSFCEKSWDMIEDTDPMNIISGRGQQKSQQTLLGLLESPNVRVGKPVIKGKE